MSTKVLLKHSQRKEWWGTANSWTNDETQAMVFSTVSEAVERALLLGIKDARVVVVGIPIAPHLLSRCKPFTGSDTTLSSLSRSD